MKRLLRAPSPAFVISLVALFVALGGTSYAALSLPANSVGTAQLKNGAVTDKKVAKKLIVYGAKAALIAGTAINAQHANIAQTANNAAEATNAMNATNANNATTVGGYAANSLTRVATSGNQCGGAITSTDGAVPLGGYVSLTAPTAGFVFVQANVSFNPSSTVTGLAIHLTDQTTGANSPDFTGPDNNSTGGSVSASEIFGVTAGVNRFEIIGQALGPPPGTGYQCDLSAVFSPFGSTGGSTP